MPNSLNPHQNICRLTRKFAQQAGVGTVLLDIAADVEEAYRAKDFDTMRMHLIDMFDEMHMTSSRGEINGETLSYSLSFWLSKFQDLGSVDDDGAYLAACAAVDTLENTKLGVEDDVAIAAYSSFAAIGRHTLAKTADAGSFEQISERMQNVMRRLALLPQTPSVEETLAHCCDTLDVIMVRFSPYERFDLIKSMRLWASGFDNAGMIYHAYVSTRYDAALPDADGRLGILLQEEYEQALADSQEWPAGEGARGVPVEFLAAVRAERQGVSSVFSVKVREMESAFANDDVAAAKSVLLRYFQSMGRLIRRDTPLTADGKGSPTIRYWSDSVAKLAARHPPLTVNLLGLLVNWIETRPDITDPIRLAGYRAVADVFGEYLHALNFKGREPAIRSLKMVLCRAAEREAIPQFDAVYDALENVWQNVLADCSAARRYQEVKDMADWLDAQVTRPERLDEIVAELMSHASGHTIPFYEDEQEGNFRLSDDGKAVVRDVPKGIEPI